MVKVEERDVLVAVLALTSLKGYPPTVRELAGAVGLKSAGSMQTRLRSMKSRGVISFDDDCPRTLVLTERGLLKCLRTN